jgi:anti-sigma factor RsiW
MTCQETEALLGASLDGELDAFTAVQVERHVHECSTCPALLARMERLREEIANAELDWSAGVDLRPLTAAVRRGAGERWWKRGWVWNATFATVAAALVLVIVPQRAGPSFERQIVDNHLRSLLADHLVDVPSSDRHTVKPWFQGKLGFAPSVPDLTADGFVLAGGRLDVIGGHQAAALVYKRRNHVINVWITPSGGLARGVDSDVVDGFQVLRWHAGQFSYWAASDLNGAELRQFADLVSRR